MSVLILAFLTLNPMPSSALEYSLPPTVIEAPPLEALSYDSLLPEERIELSPTRTLGSQWRTRSSLPLSDYGRSGALTQFRGYGRTSDDTSVQTLGVPLNPPQGGGENLAVFPQFLWSHSRYQSGVAATPLDPLASSGALTLDLWSAAKVRARKPSLELVQMLSNTLQQTAVGWAGSGETRSLALRAGMSLGHARGYSGSFSARQDHGDHCCSRTQIHLLSTDLTERSEGSRSLPTPGATVRTRRTLPVLEWSGQSLKASIFGDFARREYQDGSQRSVDEPEQAGAQLAYLTPNWTLGVALRSTHYRGSNLGEAQESTGAALANFRFDAWGSLVEIAAGVRPRLSSRSEPVLSPTLSLGARLKPSPIDTLYFRSGLTSRLPSLSDRFYSIPGFFEPNPNLRSEKTSSALLGWESALSQNLQQRLESIYQHKRDLQLLVAIDQARYQVQNTQSADLLHLRHQLDLNLGRFTFQNDLLFTRTQVGPLKNPLAYSPLFTHRIGSQALWGALSMGVFFRSQTSSRGPSGRSLGGHSLVDFEGSYLLSARPWTLELSWAVENVLDRAVDLIEDYTADGRRLSLGLVARM